MHPALSVIFFTTLSGAGYGLLFWTAYAVLCGAGQPRSLLIAIAVSVVLSTIGLLSSLWHLGKPMRAWRAFSQWRTSWLSREGVASLATFAIAMALAAALLPGMLDGDADGAMPTFNWTGRLIAVLAMASSMVTVYCTAMIYASLKPIPAWCNRLVPTVYVLFALYTGGLLASVLFRSPGAGPVLMILFAIALWIMKMRYWRSINAPLPATRGDAIGLPQRTATVFERPHTEANYLTKEMGFVVARKHARTLRIAAIVLFALLPVLLLAPAILQVDSTPLLAMAAALALAGAFVERWLFFAEAKHMVTLYY